MRAGSRAIAVALAGVVCLAWAIPARAQSSVTNRVSATAPSLGAVLAISPLSPSNRVPGGDLFVTGTVTTRHNGPYQLQARLAQPFTSRPGATPHTVLARTPDGELTALSTTVWVTVSTGPGGTGLLNAVEYLVQWGDGGPRNPETAVEVPLVYQVVPL
jgi:hypothetical protein